MASVALEHIWDAPVSPSSPQNNDQQPTSKQLFLPGSDDEQPPRASRPDVDALFENIDNVDDLTFEPLAPALDLDALRRQAEARHAFAPSSSPPPNEGSKGKAKEKGSEGKKERKQIARLDETRLLSPDGFPALIKSTKHFMPKGKGHEASDLDRLLNIYQFWTHKLYPKTQFRETVDRVEKLCHSRRMHVALSVWRDESKGIVNGINPDDAIDLTSDAEREQGDNGNGTTSDVPAHSDVDQEDASFSRRSSLPPSSASEPDNDDDFDIDAVIREEEARAAALREVSTRPTVTYRSLPPASADAGGGADEDEAMWAELNAFDEPVPVPPPSSAPAPQTQVNTNNMGDDEDMWDAVREMEMETYMPPAVAKAAPEQGQPSDSAVSGDTVQSEEVVRGTNDEGWDDMYL